MDTKATNDASDTMLCTVNIKGDNIRAQSKDEDTALHLAARAGNVMVAQVLLKKGADTTIINKGEETVLDAVLHM